MATTSDVYSEISKIATTVETEHVKSFSIVHVPCKKGYKKVGTDCIQTYK